jgi:hypothetical protein
VVAFAENGSTAATTATTVRYLDVFNTFINHCLIYRVPNYMPQNNLAGWVPGDGSKL